MSDTEMRLQALELAQGSGEPEIVLDAARLYYDFLRGAKDVQMGTADQRVQVEGANAGIRELYNIDGAPRVPSPDHKPGVLGSPVQPVEEVDPFESKSTPTSADYSELGKSVSAHIGAMTDDQFGVEENPLDPADETHPQKPSLAADLPNGHSGVWNHTEYGKQD